MLTARVSVWTLAHMEVCLSSSEVPLKSQRVTCSLRLFLELGLPPLPHPSLIRRYWQERCQRFTLLGWGRCSNSYFSWFQSIWFLSRKIKLAGPLHELAHHHQSACAGDKHHDCDLDICPDRHHAEAFPPTCSKDMMYIRHKLSMYLMRFTSDDERCMFFEMSHFSSDTLAVCKKKMQQLYKSLNHMCCRVTEVTPCLASSVLGEPTTCTRHLDFLQRVRWTDIEHQLYDTYFKG